MVSASASNADTPASNGPTVTIFLNIKQPLDEVVMTSRPAVATGCESAAGGGWVFETRELLRKGEQRTNAHAEQI